jgi:hypothetical protein
MLIIAVGGDVIIGEDNNQKDELLVDEEEN